MLRLTYPDSSVHEFTKAPDGTVNMAFRSVVIIGGESHLSVADFFDVLSTFIRDRHGVLSYASD